MLHIMSEPEREGLSAQLRQRGAASWAAATSHPMVHQIGAGTLPAATFRRYFEQNILYLKEYARSIALIIGKAPDWPAVDVLSRFLAQIIQTEIPANRAFLGRLGGTAENAEDAAAMLPVTYCYTRHLLSVCALEDCAAGLAAVLPCQWSYGELASGLLTALPADPLYADWISLFGNDDYGELVRETTSLLDRLCDSVAGPEADHLALIFDQSIGYELQFWDMAYGAAAPGGATRERE